MNVRRVLRHLSLPAWQSRRYLSARSLRAIEDTIRETEKKHRGQVRFAVETALDLQPLLRGMRAHERALELFSALRIWDTAHNNGVLIYLLLADRDVEIVADRDIHAKVGAEEWERICRGMEDRFRAGRYEEGVVEGIRAVGAHLQRHYPGENRTNELPDAPIIV